MRALVHAGTGQQTTWRRVFNALATYDFCDDDILSVYSKMRRGTSADYPSVHLGGPEAFLRAKGAVAMTAREEDDGGYWCACIRDGIEFGVMLDADELKELQRVLEERRTA